MSRVPSIEITYRNLNPSRELEDFAHDQTEMLMRLLDRGAARRLTVVPLSDGTSGDRSHQIRIELATPQDNRGDGARTPWTQPIADPPVASDPLGQQQRPFDEHTGLAIADEPNAGRRQQPAFRPNDP